MTLAKHTQATSYRQQRCPHGWVDLASCEDCAIREERDALKLELSKVIVERDSALNKIVATQGNGETVKLTKAQERAKAKLTGEWKTAHELCESLPTLEVLVARKVAAKRAFVRGVAFTSKPTIEFRLL